MERIPPERIQIKGVHLSSDAPLNIYRAENLADMHLSRSQIIADTRNLHENNPDWLKKMANFGTIPDRILAHFRHRFYHPPALGFVILQNIEHNKSREDNFGRILLADSTDKTKVRFPTFFERRLIKFLGGEIDMQLLKNEDWTGSVVLRHQLGANFDITTLMNVIGMNLTLGEDPEKRAIEFVQKFLGHK